MSYYNRVSQLDATLRSIRSNSLSDSTEIIIVDDASESDQKASLATGRVGLNVKIIDIAKKDKWWYNPCIPYNMAIKQATSPIIILQNPECMHLGDILGYIEKNLTDSNYLSFSCLNVDKATTDRIYSLFRQLKNVQQQRMFLSSLAKQNSRKELGWYNHPIHKPKAYHFLSAITKKNMDELKGFDSRYAKGWAFDDDEFLARIRRKGLCVSIVSPDTGCFVLHQFHNVIYNNSRMDLWYMNRDLYQNVTLKETTWSVCE